MFYGSKEEGSKEEEAVILLQLFTSFFFFFFFQFLVGKFFSKNRSCFEFIWLFLPFSLLLFYSKKNTGHLNIL